MERRYHSPYRHWVSGFVFEVAIFAVYLAFLLLLARAVVSVTG